MILGRDVGEKMDIGFTQVHFVAGKGGVGKTLLSRAMGHFFAKHCKTLLVEISEEEVENPLSRATIERIDNNFFCVKITPNQSLYEYLSIKIHSKFVLDNFLKHNAIRALSAAMPGLADLTRLGKIWFHADRNAYKGQEIFERIVVDMPSSGFVERFLSIASVVQNAVKVGPVAQEAQQIDAYFSDARHACLHMVTILQDLVVSETIEFFKQMRTSKIAIGGLFVNRVLPLHNDALHRIVGKIGQQAPAVVKILGLYEERAREEVRQRERLLQNGLSLPQIDFSDCVEGKEAQILDYVIAEIYYF